MPPRRELGRRIGSRRPRRTILIVCEGEETEYRYFQALKRDFRLANAVIDIVSSSRDPRSIVREAERRRGRENFDEVWCVFDREFPPDDSNFLPAVREAERLHFDLATSNPSFEFWLLIHFRYTTKSFSDNAELVADLRHEYGAYRKNRDCYDDLRNRQEQALAHAARVLREQARLAPGEQFPHPSTHVHQLVAHLASQRDFK